MFDYFVELSLKYNVSIENILSIALNRYGILSGEIKDNRVRFNIDLLNQKLFFAVGVNTYLTSPFILKGNLLYLEDKVIGKITNLERDTCTSTYFRNNKKAITFNSNSRSKCVGCNFCGTYNLTSDDVSDFTSKEKVTNYFEKLLKENNIESMSTIEDLTVCTGCFNSEEELKKHLMNVNDGIKELGFNGRINYIGSQLRNKDVLKEIKETIGDFGLYLSLEKFIDREKYMRIEKASLTVQGAKELLEYCKDINIVSTFLYILGLENLDVIEYYFNYLKDSINKYPIVQIFQDYNIEQEQYRIKEAKDVEYYLKAKMTIENILKNNDYRPNEWECFRSLFVGDKLVRK